MNRVPNREMESKFCLAVFHMLSVTHILNRTVCCYQAKLQEPWALRWVLTLFATSHAKEVSLGPVHWLPFLNHFSLREGLCLPINPEMVTRP